ncbi:MAG: purine-nucleoside phosphorylase [Bradymonadaceae bacterium]|nr:purine-nucleoside phosphorylase [Lujinxingiaceae bacterium]
MQTKESLYDRARTTAELLKSRIKEQPKVALILGSGLGALGDTLEERIAIDYSEIPGFPVSKVEGHAGQLAFGRLGGVPVAVMQGRVHYYEGWEMEDVTFPIRVFALLGIKDLVVTNSAGGINADYVPGDLMIISDHLNLTGVNVLRGDNDERFGTRFPDMSDAYTTELRQLARKAAADLGVDVKEGVYAGVAGPSYETPAEVRMIGKLGGDVVGMSTVPEVIVASHCNMRVVGISCITNLAAGLSAHKLTHEEVKITANQVRATFGALVQKLVESIGR